MEVDNVDDASDPKVSSDEKDGQKGEGDQEFQDEETKAETEEEKAAKAEAAELAALNDDFIDGEGYEYVINESLEDMAGFADEEEGDEDKPQVVFRYSHGAQARQAEEDPLMKQYGVTTQNYTEFSSQLGRRQTPFEINLDTLEDKPWRRQGATLDDYFNFGFNEQTWKEYAAKQVALRLKAVEDKAALETAEQQTHGMTNPGGVAVPQ